VPSAGGIVAAWIISGVLTLAGALVCAELASAYPRTGGVYVFLREAWGPPVGFLWGWAMFWSMHSGIIAAIATVFARYAAAFLPLEDVGERLVAIGAIVALSAVNYVGVEHGSRPQTAFTIGKPASHRRDRRWVACPHGTGRRPAERAGGLRVPGPGARRRRGAFRLGGWHMVTYTAGDRRCAPHHPDRPRGRHAGGHRVTRLNAVPARPAGRDRQFLDARRGRRR
jgi:APA family basic amino acid/polyamine antiporter